MSSRRDQDAADRHGRDRQDDYDKAAAEEHISRICMRSGSTDDQARFAAALNALLAQDGHRQPGIYDDTFRYQ